MKDTIQYLALTEAVDNFNERHYVTRGYLADIIGFKGENAAIQLSNYLNPNNETKLFNHRQFIQLLRAFDDLARRAYFDAMMKPFGYETCKIVYSDTVDEESLKSLHTRTDDAMVKGMETFKTVKISLKDKTLDKKELIAIEKEARETKEHFRDIEETARSRRVKEFGDM